MYAGGLCKLYSKLSIYPNLLKRRSLQDEAPRNKVVFAKVPKCATRNHTKFQNPLMNVY
jgi:hypothetical protein